MGRHAVQRSRAALSLLAAGSAAALVAGILSVQGQATAEAPKLSDNLVTNPDFEAGNAGWNAPGARTALTSGAGHESRRSARLTALDDGTGLVLNDSPNVVLAATSGATYTSSVWVRSDKVGLKVSLRVREIAGGTLISKGSGDLQLPDSSWHQIHLDYVVAGPDHQLAFQVYAPSTSRGSSVYIDDVDVREVLSSAADESPTPSESATPTPTPTPTETPEPDPTPTESTPAPEPSVPSTGSTLFGTSIYQGSGDSFQSALARETALYGKLDVARVFFPSLPQAWTGSALSSFDGPVAVSFKASPSQVMSGALDGQLKTWFANAPKDRPTWWTYYHEPEDDIENGAFSAADYRQAWQHISALADTANNPKLRATMILMCWSLSKGSGRSWQDYYAGSAAIDVVSFDCYNQQWEKGTYVNPADQFAAVLAVSESTGKPFAVGELGSNMANGDSGAGRAAWLRSVASFLASHHAAYVTYWDSPAAGETHQLTDAPSQKAWRDVVQAD
jgi:hypothetical protein